jgi:flavin-dependent dehydrogenase
MDPMITDLKKFDVAIIGGGPAGSTTGSLIKKYRPDLSVAIFEREKFPRDHVGESQLPTVSYVLDEMGAWDKVEQAGFPIKLGATYRWGKTPELWDFDFLSGNFKDEPRPAKFDGQRRFTAFQVDRAIYDQILLEHARELGCEVFETTKIAKVDAEGDRVLGLQLEGGRTVEANYYVDASGHSGILRRAVGVPVEYPTNLQNIAVWDYWRNAEWAEEIGVGGTRIQIMSVGFGWLWFIPLGPDRTSIGLVVPADYPKKTGIKPAELYAQALAKDERISGLLKNAHSEGKFQTTKDWSFLAQYHCGENWFLSGESSGFADPILSAGMNIAQAAAREVAFSIIELSNGKEDPEWIRDSYNRRAEKRIVNHIRFADFWYTSNAQFTDLKDFTQVIAKDNNLALSPNEAWAWIAQGGFIDEDLNTGTGGFTISAIRSMGDYLMDLPEQSVLTKHNVFRLNLNGAELKSRANYYQGRVLRDECYYRGDKVLPRVDAFDVWIETLKKWSRLPDINRSMAELHRAHANNPLFKQAVSTRLVSTLEAMITDGWVEASFDPTIPLPPAPKSHASVRTHESDRRRKVVI